MRLLPAERGITLIRFFRSKVRLAVLNFGISYQYYRLPTRYDDEHNPAMYKGAHLLMLTVNTNGLF